jgi:hypothetical protein
LKINANVSNIGASVKDFEKVCQNETDAVNCKVTVDENGQKLNL